MTELFLKPWEDYCAYMKTKQRVLAYVEITLSDLRLFEYPFICVKISNQNTTLEFADQAYQYNIIKCVCMDDEKMHDWVSFEVIDKTSKYSSKKALIFTMQDIISTYDGQIIKTNFFVQVNNLY